MSKVWMVRHTYGRIHLRSFDVARSSPKQIILKDGGAASGYRTRVAPDEVFQTELAAWEEAVRLADDAVTRARELLLVNEDVATKARVMMAKLRTPTEPSSS